MILRKDTLVKLAGLAIVLTLISSTLVSGTYAKYTKAVTGSDTTRVAKFAFNLNDGTNTITESQVGTGIFDIFSYTDAGVHSSGEDGTFIAPGTTGSFALEVENLSEVDITASLALTETNTNNIPIYYTIGAATQRYSAKLTGAYTGDSGGNYKNLSQLATDISTGIGTLQATDGATSTKGTVTLNWAWAFNQDGTGQTDADDTTLGIGGTATVQLDVAVTVTQVDAGA